MNKPLSDLKNDVTKKTDPNSLLDGNSVLYLEFLYESYLKNPQDVAPEWRDYFATLLSQNLINNKPKKQCNTYGKINRY